MTAKVNILIDQGATFSQEFNLYDDDNNPLVTTHANGAPIYTPDAQMRKSYQALNAVSFDVSLSNGALILGLTANASANVAAGRYVYDIELANIQSDDVIRVVEGVATIKPQVTR